MREKQRQWVTRILAVVSAFLMIAFFIPQRGGGGRAAMGGKTVATVYGGQPITGAERQSLLNEWDILCHRLSYSKTSNDQIVANLASKVLGPLFPSMAVNPKSFVLLKVEANHLGINVSNDELQSVLKNDVDGMPDVSDESYDGCVQSVYDLLQVKNLLNQIGGMIKISQPRGRQALAEQQQDLSISVVQIPIAGFLGSVPAPTTQDIELQYDRYSNTIAGQTLAGNTGAVVSPLGFGYRLPNRVAVQYIGFTHEEIVNAIQSAPPPTGNPYDVWDSLAERLYRENWKDFVPKATTAPDWTALTSEVQQQVYAKLYDQYAPDLTRKVMDRMTSVMSSDWQSYHEAIVGGQPAPMSSLGVPYDSNDYLRLLAAGIRKDFGVRMVLGIDEGGLKGPIELAQLPGIGAATDSANDPFPEIATQSGDKFASAAALSDSQRLALWQPSTLLFTGSGENPDGLYEFRLTAMDPSHTATLQQARPQVERDVRIQAAWDAATRQADDLEHAAQTGDGLLASVVAQHLPYETTTTDYFNAATVGEGDGTIPGLNLKLESMKRLAATSLQLLSAPSSETHPVAEVELPADQIVAVIELEGTRAEWLDNSDEMLRQSELARYEQMLTAEAVEYQWAQFDAVSKRTQYQEVQ